MNQFQKTKHIKHLFLRIVFTFARSSIGGLIVRKAFAYASWIIPFQRLRETSCLMAFFHPRPAYDFHVLLVPKRELTKIEDLSELDLDFLADLIESVRILAGSFELEKKGYSLILNGGKYQEVPILHFHLVSNR